MPTYEGLYNVQYSTVEIYKWKILAHFHMWRLLHPFFYFLHVRLVVNPLSYFCALLGVYQYLLTK
jgi:hypothetical protein